MNLRNFFNPTTQNNISALKARAARQYTTYYDELDRYDCGAKLGEQVNPRMLAAKVEFNRLMDELASIDPSCPATRL